MAVFRFQRTLLENDVSQATANTGASYIINPTSADAVNDEAQLFQVTYHLVQSGGATSPTSKVQMQHSADGTNWVAGPVSTELTSNATLDESEDLGAVGPYVRAVTVLGGGTPPGHTVKVVLQSTAPFTLITP